MKLLEKLKERNALLFGRNGWSSKKYAGIYLLKVGTWLCPAAIALYFVKPTLQMTALLSPTSALFIAGLACLGVDAYNKKTQTSIKK